MCCIPCRIHISCVTLHIKGPMYSHAFIYLNFARYISVLIMYVFVYGYKFRALLVMQDPIRLSIVVYQDLLRRVYQLIIYLYILVRTYCLYWCWHGKLSVTFKMLYNVIRFSRNTYMASVS